MAPFPPACPENRHPLPDVIQNQHRVGGKVQSGAIYMRTTCRLGPHIERKRGIIYSDWVPRPSGSGFDRIPAPLCAVARFPSRRPAARAPFRVAPSSFWLEGGLASCPTNQARKTEAPSKNNQSNPFPRNCKASMRIPRKTPAVEMLRADTQVRPYHPRRIVFVGVDLCVGPDSNPAIIPTTKNNQSDPFPRNRKASMRIPRKTPAVEMLRADTSVRPYHPTRIVFVGANLCVGPDSNPAIIPTTKNNQSDPFPRNRKTNNKMQAIIIAPVVCTPSSPLALLGEGPGVRVFPRPGVRGTKKAGHHNRPLGRVPTRPYGKSGRAAARPYQKHRRWFVGADLCVGPIRKGRTHRSAPTKTPAIWITPCRRSRTDGSSSASAPLSPPCPAPKSCADRTRWAWSSTPRASPP